MLTLFFWKQRGRRVRALLLLQGILFLHCPQESHPPFKLLTPALCSQPHGLFSALYTKAALKMFNPSFPNRKGKSWLRENQCQCSHRMQGKNQGGFNVFTISLSLSSYWEQTLVSLTNSAFPIKIGVSNRTSFP